jgi:adenylylsulfate kinase
MPSIWFTGLSGAGKTTLGKQIYYWLKESGYSVVFLDGDELRNGINNDLGFSEEDRLENIRRVAEINQLLHKEGIMVINCFIAPTNVMRQLIRNIITDDLLMIYLNPSIETCKARDPKGLYRKAAGGKIRNFTGISAPFEPFTDADLILSTEHPIGFCLSEIKQIVLHKLIDNVTAALNNDSLPGSNKINR